MKAAGIAMLDYFWNLSVNLWIWGGGVWGGTAYASMVPIFIPGVPHPHYHDFITGGHPLDPRPQVLRPSTLGLRSPGHGFLYDNPYKFI